MADRKTAKLSKRTADAAKATATRWILWDKDLKGFGMRVEPSGNKTFLVRYRAGGGRGGVLRQTNVGKYGTVTVEEARVAARKLLGAAAVGSDPVGEKRASRQAGVTVGQVCDWYIKQAETGRLRGKNGRQIKPSTLAMDRSRIDRHVRPLLGRRAVRSLSVPAIEAFQADIMAGATAEKNKVRRRGGRTSGGPGVAGRTVGMLSTIFEHAVRHGLTSENPAKGVRKILDRKRTRRLSMEEIRRLGSSLQAAETEGENSTGIAAIRALLLTGFRRREILSMQSDWLLNAGGVQFPDTKSGPQVRPLGAAAMTSLKRQLSQQGDSAWWLFPGDRGDGHFIGVVKVLDRVCARAKLSGVTPHVLRHTFASVAGDLGYSELTIAGLLGHSSRGVTQGYVHLDQALVAAADRVASVIAAALGGNPSAAVVNIRNA